MNFLIIAFILTLIAKLVSNKSNRQNKTQENINGNMPKIMHPAETLLR